MRRCLDYQQAAMYNTSEGPLERTSPSIAVSAALSVGFSAGLPFGTSVAFVSCEAPVLKLQKQSWVLSWSESLTFCCILLHAGACYLFDRLSSNICSSPRIPICNDHSTYQYAMTTSTLTIGRLTFSSYSSSSTCCTLSTPTTPCKLSLTLTCKQYKPYGPGCNVKCWALSYHAAY